MAHLECNTDNILDEVFAAVTLPSVGSFSVTETKHESHTETIQYHVETSEHMIVNSDSKIENVAETVDNVSEVSGFSKATSVSVHSSVSQKSAQHYDLPQLPIYDVPPVLMDTISDKVASKTGSQHSGSTCVSHDSESTITEGTVVEEKITYKVTSSEKSTPIAVLQSPEHDAVLNEFKELHGKASSVVSSVVPQSIMIESESESEDSIAPSKLTESIVTGHPVTLLTHSDFEGANHHEPIHKDHASNENDNHDAHSEDSFGFEHVQYVDVEQNENSGNNCESNSHEIVQTNEHSETHHTTTTCTQFVTQHVYEQPIYDPYNETNDQHKSSHKGTEQNEHLDTLSESRRQSESHQHNEGHQRSNSVSTYQSCHLSSHSIGPKITEDLRPAKVHEEEGVHYQHPPVLAYVDPIPNKPPRNYDNSHHYEAYKHGDHQTKKEIHVIKSTSVVHEDIRTGPGSRTQQESSSSVDLIGVHSLRKKFENCVPTKVSQVKNTISEDHHHHHHHNHVDNDKHNHSQVGFQLVTYSSLDNINTCEQQHHYDVPFEPLMKSPSSSQQDNAQFIYDSSVVEKLHQSTSFYDDRHHHYIPQIKVITEYRHIDPKHHYNEPNMGNRLENGNVVYSPLVQSVDYFKDIDRHHHFVPSTPTSPTKECRQMSHMHNYIPYVVEHQETRQGILRHHNFIPELPYKPFNSTNSNSSNHHYLPQINRSRSEEQERRINRQHSYIPKAEGANLNSNFSEKSNIHRNQYVPLVKTKSEEQIRKSYDTHHFFVPMICNTDLKHTDNVKHSHSYIPISKKIDNTGVKFKQEHHSYLPVTLKKADSDKAVIRDQHAYVPTTRTNKDVLPRSNASHHNYVPRISKEEDGKVINKVPTNEHHYIPIITKTDSPAELDREHHYIPPTMVKDSVPKLPREHGYIPLCIQNEGSNDKIDFKNHHYLPVVHSNQKDTPKSYEKHHYCPLPSKTNTTVRKIDNSHGYIPIVQKNETRQLPIHEHHYCPLTKSVSNDHEVLNTRHNYIPPIHHQGIEETMQRNHGYVPATMKKEERTEQMVIHNYVPIVAQKEKKNNFERKHNYIPAISKVNDRSAKAELDDHHFVPPIPIQNPKEDVDIHQHHFIPPMPKKENVAQNKAPKSYEKHHYCPLPSKTNTTVRKIDNSHGYIPIVQKNETRQLPIHEHHYCPLTKSVSNDHEGLNTRHDYIPPIHHQGTEETMQRNHGYFPATMKKEERTEQMVIHNYVPIVAQKENRNNFERKHNYIPAIAKLDDRSVKAELDDHHFVPPIPIQHPKEDVDIHQHHFIPPMPKKENSYQSKINSSYMPKTIPYEKIPDLCHSHNYIPSHKGKDLKEDVNLHQNHYTPILSQSMHSTSNISKKRNNDDNVSRGKECKNHQYVTKISNETTKNVHKCAANISEGSDKKSEAIEKQGNKRAVSRGIISHVERKHQFIEKETKENAIMKHEHQFVSKPQKHQGSAEFDISRHHYSPTIKKIKEIGKIDIHSHHYVPVHEQSSKNWGNLDNSHHVSEISNKKISHKTNQYTSIKKETVDSRVVSNGRYNKIPKLDEKVLLKERRNNGYQVPEEPLYPAEPKYPVEPKTPAPKPRSTTQSK